MSEQQSETTTNAQVMTKGACPHPEAVGTRWGDPINAERQAELKVWRDAWDSPYADRSSLAGPFDTVKLTGADVSWLADHISGFQDAVSPESYICTLKVRLRWDSPRGAFLPGAHLQGARLRFAHLEGAVLSFGHLEGAHLYLARLEEVDLSQADLMERTSARPI